MPRPRTEHPTPGELDVLNILWDRGPCTAREVWNVLNERRERHYTSVNSLLNTMVDKGLLKRHSDQRAFVYEAAIAREKTQGELVQGPGGSGLRGVAQRLGVAGLGSMRSFAGRNGPDREDDSPVSQTTGREVMFSLDVLGEPVWQRLTWTLLHFLWQGLAVAAVVATLLYVWPVGRAHNRYLIYLTALIAMAACPLVTFMVIDAPASATVAGPGAEPEVEVVLAPAPHRPAGRNLRRPIFTSWVPRPSSRTVNHDSMAWKPGRRSRLDSKGKTPQVFPCR